MLPSPRTEEVLTLRSDTHSSTVTSPAPGVIPDTIYGPVSDPPPVEIPNTARAREAAAAANGTETQAQHLRRKALRLRLHEHAIAAVALVAVLIALAASNTAHVKVNWLIATSHISLVWLVLVTAIVGWLLGLLASARFNWLTRAPERRSRARS
ncbi:MAG: LapA family protein [Solirubrobacteraceae bacterium]